MANHAGIVIGINQYQFFQPLNYAQADAQALHNFLVAEAGWSSDSCLLLTDTSPAVCIGVSEVTGEEYRSTYPTKENILALVRKTVQRCANSGDLLWFFLTGYGVTQADEDYLMPIDGNPNAVAETGIPIKALFEQLATTKARCLVLLDINRSQSLQNHTHVGQQIIDLAQKLQIPTILSCQIDQFSHEAKSLGHGLFTSAILEALRYNPDATISDLDYYLRTRLPELSEHHWQPIQTPLTVELPIEIKEQPILCSQIDHEMAQNQAFNPPTVIQPPVINSSTQPPSVHEEIPQKANPTSIEPESLIQLPIINTQPAASELESQADSLTEEPAQARQPSDQPKSESNLGAAKSPKVRSGVSTAVKPSKPSARRTRAGGTNNRERKQLVQVQPKGQSPAGTTSTPWWQKLLLWSGGAGIFMAIIAVVVFRNTQVFNFQANDTGNNQNLANQNNQIDPNNTSEPTLPSPNSTSTPTINQAPLVAPIPSSEPMEASQLNRAIAQAQKVPPGTPQYEKAQQEIANWSREIVNIAENRAKQKNYSGAIAAARLVPPEQPIYPQAQKSIQQWQQLAKQQWSNQVLLQAAKALIERKNASSYNRAITVANKIPPGQPGYTEAQQLTAQWSKSIYQIAQSRAAKGRYKEAIQTATLVPEDTPYYGEALKAIAKWQQVTKN